MNKINNFISSWTQINQNNTKNFEVCFISSDKVSYSLIIHYVFMICLTNSSRNFVWHKSVCFGTAHFLLTELRPPTSPSLPPRLLFEFEFGHKQNCYRVKVYFYHLAPIHIRACIPFQFFDAWLPIINGTTGSWIRTFLSISLSLSIQWIIRKFYFELFWFTPKYSPAKWTNKEKFNE